MDSSSILTQLGEITNSPARYSAGKKTLKSANNQQADHQNRKAANLSSSFVEVSPDDGDENDMDDVENMGVMPVVAKSTPKKTPTKTISKPAEPKVEVAVEPEVRSSRRPSMVVPVAWQADANAAATELHAGVSQGAEEPVRTVVFAPDELNTSVEYVATASLLPKRSASKTLSARKSASKPPRTDEIERLKKVLVSQEHWTKMRDALARIHELVRRDEIEGEGLVRLSHALGLHVNNGRSQLALAACDCVRAACEVSSLSSKVRVEDFELFSRQMIGPMANLASSLSTGCKSAQEAGISCLCNLYLNNPKLDLNLVLGPESFGTSKNVAARRAAADLVLNVIIHGLTVDREAILADAVTRFFTDSDPDTRKIARAALREFVARRSAEWIESHVMNLVREKLAEEKMPHLLKQFSWEYPESSRLLGLETPARALSSNSAVKSAVRFQNPLEEAVMIIPSLMDKEFVEEAANAIHCTPTKMTVSTSEFNTPTESTPPRSLNREEKSQPSSHKMLDFRDDPIAQTAELRDSPMGDLLLRRKIENQHLRRLRSEGNEVDVLRSVEEKEEKVIEASSPFDDKLLARKRALAIERRWEEASIPVEPIAAPLGTSDSSPMAQRLLDRKQQHFFQEELKEVAAIVPEEVKMQSSGKTITKVVVGIIALLGAAFLIASGGQVDLDEALAIIHGLGQAESSLIVEEGMQWQLRADDSIVLAEQEQVHLEIVNELSLPEEVDSGLETEQGEEVVTSETVEHDVAWSGEGAAIETVKDIANMEGAPQPEIHTDKAKEADISDDITEDVSVRETLNAVEEAADRVVEVVAPVAETDPKSGEATNVDSVKQEKPAPDATSSGDSILSIPFVLCLLVAYVFKPTSPTSSADEFVGAEEEISSASGSENNVAPATATKRKRVSPPKGRFNAIEVVEESGHAKLRPVTRSRRVVEPETVSVQDAGVTVITPRKPLGRRARSGSRGRSKSK